MAPTRTQASFALAALLVVSFLAVPALAQTPAPQVTVKLDQATLSLGANNTTQITGNVTYAHQLPSATGTITITVDAPQGWNVTVEPATAFTLQPGATAPFTLTINAPVANQGAVNGTSTVTASANAGTGGGTGTGSATLALTRVDPPPPPPPSKLPLILGITAAILVVAAGGALYARQRRLKRIAAEKEAAERAAAERAAYIARETGIAIKVHEAPKPFGDRREVVARLLVTNTSERPRVGALEIREATPGWLAAVSVPKPELAPGASMIVSLSVRPPNGAPEDATAKIVVAARPEEARELDERVTIDVHAPIPVPSKDQVKSFVAARDGVVPRAKLRY